MRTILIVGAGQSGLQLGLSLLAEGYDVTLISDRTAAQIRAGAPTSTQVMFHPALQTERAYGLNLWETDTPPIAGLHLVLSAPPGHRALEFAADLDHPAQSTDQRLKLAAWLELFQHRGGAVRYRSATAADLDTLTAGGHHELTIVATGRSGLVEIFARNPARSPYSTPQRVLAAAYVHGLDPDPARQRHGGFHAVPGVGELLVLPALTLSGACDILFWEAIPGGPADRWPDGPTRLPPAGHLGLLLQLTEQYIPWVYGRCGHLELTDARATLSGRLTPTVREPVARFPGGGIVLGMADAVIVNDPITGQGSNTAARCADAYRRAILDRGDQPFDETWMRETFEQFWIRTGRAVTEWTNAMLRPLPPYAQQILAAAATNPAVARRFANGFDDPTDLSDWFMTPQGAARYLASVEAEGGAQAP